MAISLCFLAGGAQSNPLVLSSASAQGAVECIQRPALTAAPPPAPPSPRGGLAKPITRNSNVAGQVAPVCPDGQIPVLPSERVLNAGATASPLQKGNPLLRPQNGLQFPGAAPTTKFLRFDDVYGRRPKMRSNRPSNLSRAPNTPKCVFQDDTCYYYASAGLQTIVDGAGMTLSVDGPAYVNDNAQGHTLDEIAIQGGPNNDNVVELGWTVSTDQNGDPDPHIFVFHWINGNGTCYNGCGWQQFSNRYYPGQNIKEQKGLDVYVGYVFYKGNWWAWFDNQWLGYFPETLWSNGFSKTDLIQWFGEVATTSTDAPLIQMGSGVLPPPPSAAHMFTLCEVDAKAWICRNRDQQVLAAPTVANYYDIKRIGVGMTRYGGPGKR